MKSGSKKWSLVVFPVLLFGNAAVSQAAATLTVSPSGNGQYVVRGSGLEGFAGADVIVQYDKTALKNPRIVGGELVSGSMMVTNANQDGIVRIAAIYAYPQTKSGTGTIATITFDSTSASSPTINVTSDSKVVDFKGAQIPLTVVPFTNADSSTQTVTYLDTSSGGNTGAGGNTGSGGNTSGTTSAGGGTGYPVWLGGVNMSADGTTVEAKVKEGASTVVPAPEKVREQSGEALGKEKAEPAGEVSQKAPLADNSGTGDTSILEQFRLFQGEGTPKNLMALFTKSVAGSGQKPLVALSDGKTRVQVTVECPSAGKKAPNFALKGAKLVSLRKSGASTWVVEALPDKGTFNVTVKVLQDGVLRQIPLTVVPPLPANIKIGNGGKLTEADFNQFLKERGTDKAPRFDLNGDGKRDYVDDYIFTANYLVKLETAETTADAKPQK